MQENYKILVVDDDMRLRALLERYLTEQGFQVWGLGYVFVPDGSKA